VFYAGMSREVAAGFSVRVWWEQESKPASGNPKSNGE
jgi:hypothetical protein